MVGGNLLVFKGDRGDPAYDPSVLASPDLVCMYVVVRMYACMHVYKHTHTHTYVYTYIHTDILFIFMYIYTHTLSLTHTHTLT